MPKGKIGIELGSRYLRICASDKDDISHVSSVIALNQQMELVAIGNEAYSMFEKEPYAIHIISPMTHGVIGDYTNMRLLLRTLMSSYAKRFRKYHYMVAAPVDISNIEKRAFYDLIWEASPRVKGIELLAKPMVDAVGLGIKVKEPRGNMVVNFGADTCEISVISLGGIVGSRLLKVGGNQLDHWIVGYMRRHEKIEIGRKTAQNFKYQYAKSEELDKSFLLKGRDVVTGLPISTKVPLSVIDERIHNYVLEVCMEVRNMLEVIPPELAADIMIEGIYISGGGAHFKKMNHWMEEVLQIPIRTSAGPQESVIRGLKELCSRKNDR